MLLQLETTAGTLSVCRIKGFLEGVEIALLGSEGELRDWEPPQSRQGREQVLD